MFKELLDVKKVSSQYTRKKTKSCDSFKKKIRWTGPFQQVFCCNYTIEITDVAKSLGLLLDSMLLWENRVRKVSNSFVAQLRLC